MFELSSAPFFVFVPFISFAAIFLLLVLIKCCMYLSRNLDTTCPTISSCLGDGPTAVVSTRPMGRRPGGLQSQHSNSSLDLPSPLDFATNTREPEPPSYYAGVTTTITSQFYPMQVPSYANAPPVGSLRDPRHFQGLAGVQAPPPYPPPPSYNQLEHIPELPTITHMRLNNGNGSNAVVKSSDSFPPVD